MRNAFDAVLAESSVQRVELAEARVADLEEELRKIASARSRRPRKPKGEPRESHD
jgi:hypothetical protein